MIKRTIKHIFDEEKEKDFNEINQKAENLFPEEPILLEDLWFWVRFYRNKNKKNYIYGEFNKNLLIIDRYATKEFREEFLRFEEKEKRANLFKELLRKNN